MKLPSVIITFSFLVTFASCAIARGGYSSRFLYGAGHNPYAYGFRSPYQHKAEQRDSTGAVRGEYGYQTPSGNYLTTVYQAGGHGSIFSSYPSYASVAAAAPSPVHAVPSPVHAAPSPVHADLAPIQATPSASFGHASAATAISQPSTTPGFGVNLDLYTSQPGVSSYPDMYQQSGYYEGQNALYDNYNHSPLVHHQHEEQGHLSGTKTGRYWWDAPDGLRYTVDYVADPLLGYHPVLTATASPRQYY